MNKLYLWWVTTGVSMIVVGAKLRGYVSPGWYVFLFAQSSYRIGVMTFPSTTEW